MIRKLSNWYNALSIQVKATLWFFLCSVLQRGISTITTPIFTRLLSTAEYGRFSVFSSWLSICQVIITLQLSAGVYTMGIVKFKEEEKLFTSSLQGLNFVLCLIWTIIYSMFRRYWNMLLGLTTVQVLAMLLMIWATASFGFWMTTQRNQYKYRKLIMVTLITSVLKPAVGIFFIIHAEDKVTARILALALVEVIVYTGFFISQMKQGRKFYSGRFWKYALLFNLPLIPHYLAGTILGSSDRIMIQKMVGDSESGVYSLAYNISLLMTMVNDSLNKTMSPCLYQKIRSKNYREIPKVVYPSLILVAAANLLLIAVAPEIIALFAPYEYLEAVYVIPPVAMSTFAQYLYLCFAPFEFYFEKRIWTTIGTFISAAANLILNYFFINWFGYLAAGYTTLVCYAINSMMHYYFMRKVCKQHLDNIRPYRPKILIVISALFLTLGFVYILTYSNIFCRYALTFMMLAGLLIQRNRVLPIIKEIMKK